MQLNNRHYYTTSMLFTYVACYQDEVACCSLGKIQVSSTQKHVFTSRSNKSCIIENKNSYSSKPFKRQKVIYEAVSVRENHSCSFFSVLSFSRSLEATHDGKRLSEEEDSYIYRSPFPISKLSKMFIFSE